MAGALAREHPDCFMQTHLSENHQEIAQTKALFDNINGSGLLAEAMDTLSMGMTADVEAAAAAGSTMVRVGTAIFGGR